MEQRPAVTTYLFTDVEGSTRLWEQEPLRMGLALARHDALSREAVEAHRGAVVKSTGDGILAAFGDPLDALHAVLQLQLALADPRNTSEVALCVRSGLHAGVDERRANDFFGPAVSRAARIMGAAHGGQILLSQAVVALVGERLPTGVALRDLGAVRLRGLASPELVHQVVHQQLRQDFPALRSLEATPTNLPQPVTSFIGREAEVAEVRKLLGETRLLTLLGIGGLGKTRLSLQVAAEVLDDYPDGVWFVELAALSDPHLVVNAVAATLGVREEAGQPLIATLQKFVKDREILLVLDNCEHLIVTCAQLARDLLESGRKATILATSREPLHVAGEAVFPLATLITPDSGREFSVEALGGYAAVQLFLERAIDARPDFALTRENAAAVARICRDLDGIPLALELAAARVRSMSAEAIAEHLTDRFALLKGGDRTALPRQQTLRAAIDWSYDLLAPPERALLRRLSVFAGGFTFDAAEVVGTGDDVASGDVLELLDHLVDKSLVAFDAQTERYRLLETVRQYAHERLAEAGDEAASRDRHLGFYVTLAQRAGSEILGPKQDAWHRRLDAERENILLAFDHTRNVSGGASVALTMVHGYFLWLTWKDHEFWHRVTLDALAHPDAQPETVARSRALYVAGFLAYMTGRYEQSFTLAQSSVRIARACEDAPALGQGLYTTGIAAIAVDHPAEAREHFVEGLALARQMGDRPLIAVMSCGLGELYSQQAQFELAECAYLEALADNQDDPRGSVIVLYNLARNAIACRTDDKAVHFLRNAVATADPQITIQSGLSFLTICAGIAGLREEWTLALRFSGAAASYKERHGLWGEFVDAPFHARSSADARDALGADAADAAFAAGRALSVDAALREAEAWLDALPAAEDPP